MVSLLDIFLCGITTIIEFIGIIGIGLFIQLIVYQLTGFSIANNLWKSLIRLEKHLENKI